MNYTKLFVPNPPRKNGKLIFECKPRLVLKLYSENYRGLVNQENAVAPGKMQF